jgi:hypothetical protein
MLVLYECGTWSSLLETGSVGERSSDYIFGPKKEEITGESIKIT